MSNEKIRPFLWYDQSAEQAAEFYCSLFPDSRIISVARYPEGAMAPAGTAMTVEFELRGLRMVALNGGPHFKFNEAISLSIDCEDQKEVDYYWEKLTQGGQPSRCGWLKDRYGLSWQVVPRALQQLMGGGDAGQAQRVMGAMMQMGKIDVAALEKAARS